MAEQLVNNGIAVLDGTIDDTVTSLDVLDGSVFPSSGNFRLLIGSEIMVCTARSTNTLTVTRGQEGTTAASHTDGATVAAILTAAGLAQYVSENGGGGSVPSWISNTFFLETYPDTPNSMDDEFDDGTGFSGSVNGLDSRWTWRNQGTATVTFDKAGYLTLTPPAQSSANMRILEQNFPAADCEFICKVAMSGYATNFSDGGIILVDGTNGDLYRFAVELNGNAVNGTVLVQKWNSVTSFNTTVVSKGIGGTAGYLKVKYTLSTTTFEFWFSSDGVGFVRLASFTDTVGVTKIGIFVDQESNNTNTKARFDFFRRTV